MDWSFCVTRVRGKCKHEVFHRPLRRSLEGGNRSSARRARSKHSVCAMENSTSAEAEDAVTELIRNGRYISPILLACFFGGFKSRVHSLAFNFSIPNPPFPLPSCGVQPFSPGRWMGCLSNITGSLPVLASRPEVAIACLQHVKHIV